MLVVAPTIFFVQQMQKFGLGLPALRGAPADIVEVATYDDSEPAMPAPAETTNNPSGGLPISQKQQDAIAQYTVALAATKGMSEWVQGVESGYADGQVDVQVTLYYLAQNKAVRLEVASILAEAWGGIYQPQVPERSHLNLVDSQGRSVGGHKAFSGALYVDD